MNRNPLLFALSLINTNSLSHLAAVNNTVLYPLDYCLLDLEEIELHIMHVSHSLPECLFPTERGLLL